MSMTSLAASSLVLFQYFENFFGIPRLILYGGTKIVTIDGNFQLQSILSFKEKALLLWNQGTTDLQFCELIVADHILPDHLVDFQRSGYCETKVSVGHTYVTIRI
jgi:hypothetical protein